MLPGAALSKPSRQSKLAALLKKVLIGLIIAAVALAGRYLWLKGAWGSISSNQAASTEAAPLSSVKDATLGPLRRHALPADTLKRVVNVLDVDVAQHLLPSETDVPETMFKNPCWRSNKDGQLRCLPYAHILGGKSGRASPTCDSATFLLRPRLITNCAFHLTALFSLRQPAGFLPEVVLVYQLNCMPCSS